MPRLSLYRPEKTNDYKFMDRTIYEMFTVGGTDMYVHKYLGPIDQGPSPDFTQPQYAEQSPLNIQDLLFLENRDRKYAPDIYRIRGHYNVQNLDFDLSQFGLFLNNDIIFITVHYNNMIDLIGRKLMVGDVLELPHLTDYHPLNDKLPTSLRRYYQITDSNYASEGFSQTWYPHLWRIKCEPLVDSQEFSNILEQPTNKDNYLGDWDRTKTYVPGYTVTYGDKIYTPKAPGPVPAGTPCTDTTYWDVQVGDSLKDIISRYNQNIAINDAAIAESSRIVPLSGYDRSQLYVLPTDGKGKPATPVDLVVYNGAPITGTLQLVQSTRYTQASPVIRVNKQALAELEKRNLNSEKITSFIQMNLEVAELPMERTDNGSGPVEPTLVLAVQGFGPVNVPFGTADNTYAFSDADPSDPNFDQTLINPDMDYRADCDPRFRFIVRTSPQGFGYLDGYLVGTGAAPNGEPVTSAITFPPNPTLGQYVLRIDYLPQQLFRWDGSLWIKISENVRTGTGLTSDNQSQISTFINNNNITSTNNGDIPQQQPLSSILRIKPD